MDKFCAFTGLTCCSQVREPKGRSFRFSGDADEQAGSARGPKVTYAGGNPGVAKAYENSRPLAGVGVVFLCTADGALAVHSLLPGGPADKTAQISAGDRLLTVDGTSIDELDDRELATRLVGDAGSSVTLSFERTNGGARYQVAITREPVSAKVAKMPLPQEQEQREKSRQQCD